MWMTSPHAAICPGTIDNDFRRKSSSAVRGFAPAEGFDKALLSVDDGESSQLASRSKQYAYTNGTSYQRNHSSLLGLTCAFAGPPTHTHPLHRSKLEFTNTLHQASAQRYRLPAQYPLPTGLLALGYAFPRIHGTVGQEEVRAGIGI